MSDETQQPQPRPCNNTTCTKCHKADEVRVNIVGTKVPPDFLYV